MEGYFKNPYNLFVEEPMFFSAGFEVVLSTSEKVYFISFNENALKMMKNAFYFMLKLFLFLKYIHFF